MEQKKRWRYNDIPLNLRLHIITSRIGLMKRFQSKTGANGGSPGMDYIADMIAQLAKLAKLAGEPGVAIHLEAILAARRATAMKRTAA